MITTLTAARKLGQLMYENDADNLAIMQGCDDIYDMKYDPPEQLDDLPWARITVSSRGQDAIEAGVRIFSGATPDVRIEAVTDGKATKKKTKDIQSYLKWQFELSGVRDEDSNALKETNKESMLHDRICMRVAYLPWEKDDLMERAKARGNEEMLEEIEKFLENKAEFYYEIFDAKNVHARIDRWGLRYLMTREVNTYGNLKALYGEKELANVKKRIGEDTSKQDADIEETKITVFEMWTRTHRFVWGAVNTGTTDLYSEEPEKGVHILTKEHGLPFIPFAFAQGNKKIRPMLYSVWKSKQWEDECFYLTLVNSEALHQFGSPNYAIIGPGGDLVRIMYWVPGQPLILEEGQNIVPLQKPQIDPALRELIQDVANRIERSTVSSVLMGGALPENVAFSTMNLATQSALKVMAPHQQLSQKLLQQVMVLMLRWKVFTKDEIEVFNDKNIPASDIVITALPITVTLNEDLPTDQQARIRTGGEAVQVLGYSKKKALSLSGEPEPEKVIKEGYFEKLTEAKIAGMIAFEQEKTTIQIEAAHKGLMTLAHLTEIPEIRQDLEALEQKAQQLEEERMKKRSNGTGAASQVMEGGGDGGSMSDPSSGGIPDMMAEPGLQTFENVQGGPRNSMPEGG